MYKRQQEETAPDFEHAASDALPVLEAEGKSVRLILGNAYGERVPVRTHSELFYADAVLQPHAHLPLPDDHEDRGIYLLSGEVSVAGQTLSTGQMAVFRPGDAISVQAGHAGARLILLGGATLNGPRHIWWNFVSSSRERIDDAKHAWQRAAETGNWDDSGFVLPPGDDQEFIPLP